MLKIGLTSGNTLKFNVRFDLEVELFDKPNFKLQEVRTKIVISNGDYPITFFKQSIGERENTNDMIDSIWNRKKIEKDDDISYTIIPAWW